ncbi:TPM domain-containing protein [Hymenobacter chitinivorans]|uniref:Putative membrane protein YgcG n=1 Tax=Hymenobacter chitinivorans DSM 11115 TaxID=1121954 RepID=A0A2M9ARI9_9BACT|nr:TPM domain-containing protein [Hymenobacter chitinivorans]PJJ48321.1 putative membrane protein YgcG [Hymenobacter chitinivorans DSM 11115]
MPRLLFLVWAFLAAILAGPAWAAPADDIPPRPTPFRFVTDQGQLLSPAEAKTLEGGLRRYADNTGTQIVVVTVPTLEGRSVADYGRELGQTWGIGQRDKDNGLVILLGAQEHQVTVQAGAGLRSAITPELTARVIKQDMTPRFKQGNYFAGLRAGLNTLMLAANPDSNPQKNQPAPAASPAPSPTSPELSTAEPGAAAAPISSVPVSAPEPESSGFGLGTLALGALVIGGGIWLLTRLFRRSSAPAGSPAPDFLPNRGTSGGYNQPGYNQAPGRQPAPDFLPNRGSGSGSGVGGMLMTGAAAAAGAYLGNRMASSHDTPHNDQFSPDSPAPHLGYGAAGPATSGGFPALDGPAATDNPAPDYFSEDSGSSSAPDYFSSDESSSYDDPSSGDSGGGGFDDTNDNSGSW